MGKSKSGSSNSRLRVRMESAAKKVPLTTRAQVPSGKTRASSQPWPNGCKLRRKMAKTGARMICTTETKRKLAITFARNSEEGGAGTIRCASSTWWHEAREPTRLIERGDRGEERSNAEDSTGNLS